MPVTQHPPSNDLAVIHFEAWRGGAVSSRVKASECAYKCTRIRVRRSASVNEGARNRSEMPLGEYAPTERPPLENVPLGGGRTRHRIETHEPRNVQDNAAADEPQPPVADERITQRQGNRSDGNRTADVGQRDKNNDLGRQRHVIDLQGSPAAGWHRQSQVTIAPRPGMGHEVCRTRPHMRSPYPIVAEIAVGYRLSKICRRQ